MRFLVLFFFPSESLFAVCISFKCLLSARIFFITRLVGEAPDFCARSSLVLKFVLKQEKEIFYLLDDVAGT